MATLLKPDENGQVKCSWCGQEKKGAPKCPSGRGRLRDFDKALFENLCHIHCTVDEIEAILNTNQQTIDKWCLRTYKAPFKVVRGKYSEGGKASLRRNQFALSKKNAAMSIWLGKQYLNQKDLPQDLEEFSGKLSDLLQKLNLYKKHTKDAVTT